MHLLLDASYFNPASSLTYRTSDLADTIDFVLSGLLYRCVATIGINAKVINNLVFKTRTKVYRMHAAHRKELAQIQT